MHDGVLAEQVLLQADGVVKLPEHLSYAEGATLPVTAESKYEVAGQAWAFGAYAALVA